MPNACHEFDSRTEDCWVAAEPVRNECRHPYGTPKSIAIGLGHGLNSPKACYNLPLITGRPAYPIAFPTHPKLIFLLVPLQWSHLPIGRSQF